MTIVLVGLNHLTTPIELREKLSLTGSDLNIALAGLRNQHDMSDDTAHSNSDPHLLEGVILSTCNRLEVYAASPSRDAGLQAIERFLDSFENVSADELRPHLYHLDGTAAVTHLMRVACGLDSMILGEPQVLGQVAQAFNDAQSAGMTGAVLSRLFSQAIHAGKRARAETDIGRYTTSVSHAGVLKVLENLNAKDASVLIVGAGDMAILAAKALKSHKVNNLAFINRTHRYAAALAEEYGGTSLGWHQLSQALVQVDAVITATGAPHPVIHRFDVESVLADRAGRPLVIVDIAVPRDVEVTVGDLDGVRRFDIDHLQSIVDGNTALRKTAIPAVEAIIKSEIRAFLDWHHSREVSPVIRDLRRWANQVAEAEVAQALNKLPDDDPQIAAVVNRLAHRIVNKLLHEPTVRLRGHAAEGNGHSYTHAVYDLFGLQAGESEGQPAAVGKAEGSLANDSLDLQYAVDSGNSSRNHGHEN